MFFLGPLQAFWGLWVKQTTSSAVLLQVHFTVESSIACGYRRQVNCWYVRRCLPSQFLFKSALGVYVSHSLWTDCDLRNSYPGQTKHWSEVYSRFFCKPHNSRCSRCLARAQGRVLVVCLRFAPERTQADRLLSVRRCMLARPNKISSWCLTKKQPRVVLHSFSWSAFLSLTQRSVARA